MLAEFDLDQWAAAPVDAYEYGEEQMKEIADLLQPAIDKCRELGTPFAFIFQGGMDKALGVSLNGCMDPVDINRCSPNMLLFNMLFAMREQLTPEQAVITICQFVQQKLTNLEDVKPTIFIP